MPTSPRGRARTGWIVVLVVIVAGAVTAGVIATRSHNKTKQTTTTVSLPPAVPETPPPTPATFAVFRDKMGLATGQQLWSAKPAAMDKEIAGIAATGAKWVRTSLVWKDVEPTSANADDWAKADHLVAESQKFGVGVIFAIGNAPNWAGAQSAGEFGTDPADYARFVAKVATRYRGKVKVYELGNEPNHVNYVTHPDPAAYTKLLKASYAAIKAVNPDAFVLTGGIGGTRGGKGNIDGLAFVKALYADGAKGSFDGIAYHPYTYPDLPTQDIKDRKRGWSRMLSVRQTMVDNGDSAKSIWITEFGAPTNGPGGVSGQEQATMLTNGFALWKTYSWGGAMCTFSYQDKGTDASTHKDWFGLVTASGAPKPSYSGYSSLARG